MRSCSSPSSRMSGTDQNSPPWTRTRTSGLASRSRRLRNHAGCFSAPANEATTVRTPSGSTQYGRAILCSLPDLRPTVRTSTWCIPTCTQTASSSVVSIADTCILVIFGISSSEGVSQTCSTFCSVAMTASPCVRVPDDSVRPDGSSEHELPAVHVQLGAGDDAGQVGGEERHRVGAVRVVGDDPEGDVLGDVADHGVAVHALRDGVLDVALDRGTPHPAHEGAVDADLVG